MEVTIQTIIKYRVSNDQGDVLIVERLSGGWSIHPPDGAWEWGRDGSYLLSSRPDRSCWIERSRWPLDEALEIAECNLRKGITLDRQLAQRKAEKAARRAAEAVGSPDDRTPPE